MSEEQGISVVSEKILEIINRSPNKLIYVAALGNRLTKEYGKPLRLLIPNMKLTEFITTHLNGQVTLSGASERLLANLDSEPSAQTSLPLGEGSLLAPEEEQHLVPRRYDSHFWAAFIAPPHRNHWRAIQPLPPFEWADRADGQPPKGWIEIDLSRIPSRAQPWPQRKRAASIAIERWCEQNGLRPEDFAAENTARGNAGPVSGTDTLHFNIEGALALYRLAEAISPESRNKESLSISIILSILRK